MNICVSKVNLAPVGEYATDVGLRTSLVTMNPSVVQRAFQDLNSEEWVQRFVHRLQSLSGSVLWIPAFMAKGGEERVEWAIRLILLHTVNVRTAFPSLRPAPCCQRVRVCVFKPARHSCSLKQVYQASLYLYFSHQCIHILLCDHSVGLFL